MRYLLVCLLLAGCTTVVPVTQKFPNPPGSNALTECPSLVKLNDDAQLSDVAVNVATNYTTYYECSLKNSAWIEWYNSQKKLFESVK